MVMQGFWVILSFFLALNKTYNVYNPHSITFSYFVSKPYLVVYSTLVYVRVISDRSLGKNFLVY